MISREERDAIRARYVSWGRIKRELLDEEKFITNALRDIPALLDALNEVELRHCDLSTAYNLMKAYAERTEADRDRWKARAEAAEAESTKITAEYNRLADGLYVAHKAKKYLERLKVAEARAEALERAILNRKAEVCSCCVNLAIGKQYKYEPCVSCNGISNWKFDEAQFKKVGDEA